MIFTQAQVLETQEVLIKAGRTDLANTLILEVSAAQQTVTKYQAVHSKIVRLETILNASIPVPAIISQARAELFS